MYVKEPESYDPRLLVKLVVEQVERKTNGSIHFLTFQQTEYCENAKNGSLTCIPHIVIGVSMAMFGRYLPPGDANL